MEGIVPKSTLLKQALDKAGKASTSSNRLLTVPEACGYLRISKWTLYRLIQGRELKTVKIGSRRLVRKESIVAFVEQLEEN